MKKIEKTDSQWRSELSLEQYDVTRRHATEPAFSNPLNNEKRQGMFHCVCCGAELFDSSAKYDSGSGWPSFYQPVDDSAISEHVDKKLFQTRIETRCARCDAHLGHVFADGPQPTGLRYCMNGTALEFQPSRDDE